LGKRLVTKSALKFNLYRYAEVAKTELWAVDGAPLPNPRTYSLRKLVDVAAINMERVRMVWSRIWHVVSSLLVGRYKLNPVYA
jgi:Sec7-like guanine-nucleotide exchange factor